jgi:predicted dehydrogenase
MTTIGVGVVGCGLIGMRRAAIAAAHPSSSLRAVTDRNSEPARQAATTTGCDVEPDWEALVAREDIDLVVVATTHDYLFPITAGALRAGKNVLCEKPMCLNAAEAAEIVAIARRYDRYVEVGFNHRYHPAIIRARAMLHDGVIGTPMFMRCRYGHGGRPGYDKEWRMDPKRSGGGELLDQGIHGLDLFRFFMGEFAEVTGVTANWIWKTDVEDNVFAILKSASGQVANLHASWTQWKNIFSFEVFGESGALVIDGLGGSYGPETLTIHRRQMAGGAPQTEVLEFEGPDLSWQRQWNNLMSNGPRIDADDGLQAHRLVAAVYESSRTGRTIAVDHLELK